MHFGVQNAVMSMRHSVALVAAASAALVTDDFSRKFYIAAAQTKFSGDPGRVTSCRNHLRLL